MSKVNFVELFIQIIGFYGFKISQQVVNEIVSKSKIKEKNKNSIKVKPFIGIHFAEKCCLDKGQIINYYVPYNCNANKPGWSDYCSESKSNVYLNKNFENKRQICGIFVNFEVWLYTRYLSFCDCSIY